MASFLNLQIGTLAGGPGMGKDTAHLEGDVQEFVLCGKAPTTEVSQASHLNTRMCRIRC